MLLFLVSNLLLITSIFPITSSQEQKCSAVLQNGVVNGFEYETINPNQKLCAFLGIPYAKPPVGDLRFKPPQPAENWNTALNATSFPNWCPQAANPPPDRIISENCLQLNVYQPLNASGLPVMIWFYGGSFTSGSSDKYTPSKLLKNGDVILVVVHYRVGVMGFFTTGDDVVPGNNGLKDQSFSIKWVHDNINAFGGNPDKVTIFGESAGGNSVLLQYLSPLNKGLIHGVISQSGTPLSNSIDRSNPSVSGKKVAMAFGCSLESTQEMVACMREIPWETIILIQAQNLTQIPAGIDPVIEPDLPGALIKDEPLDILKYGDIPDIPLVIGANQHEGSAPLAGMYLSKIGPQNLDKDPDYMRNQIVQDILASADIDADSAARIMASTAELAFLSGVNRSSWNESVPGLVDMLTVFSFKSGIQHFADILVSRNRTVYLYSNEYHSNNSLWSIIFGEYADSIPIDHGVAHGDELLYLFDFPVTLSERDKAFSELICGLWVEFGKHGKPTPFEDNAEFEWTPYNIKSEPYAKLDITPRLLTGWRNSWQTNASN